MTYDEDRLPPIQEHARATRNEVVQRIQRARADAGMTISDLCDRLNANGWEISPSTLSGILSGGKRHGFLHHELDYLAASLHCSVLDLLPESVTKEAEARLLDSSVQQFMDGFSQAKTLLDTSVRAALERVLEEGRVAAPLDHDALARSRLLDDGRASDA